MASAPPDGTAKGRSNGKRRKHAGKCQRYAGEYRKTPGTRRKIPGNKGRTSGKSGCRNTGIPECRNAGMPECRNAGEGGREMPENRLKSNQPQSILRLIFHINRDKGTRSGNSLSHPVRRIAATAGTIKKAADRASSVCRKQECYLKVGVVNQKTLGCAVPALGI